MCKHNNLEHSQHAHTHRNALLVVAVVSSVVLISYVRSSVN